MKKPLKLEHLLFIQNDERLLKDLDECLYRKTERNEAIRDKIKEIEPEARKEVLKLIKLYHKINLLMNEYNDTKRVIQQYI